MTTPGAPGDLCNDSASKQGILSFFQNIKTKGEDIIQVVDSDDEKTTGGEKEPLPARQLESPSKGNPKNNETLDNGNKSNEIIAIPESSADQKRRQKEEKRQKREELKRQKQADKQRREEEKLRIQNEKKAREEEKLRKENEKRAKEEAKERSQSRINNFFKKVTDSNKPAYVRSDYEKFFLPFYSKEGVITSQSTQLSSDELCESRSRIDSLINQKGNHDNQVLEWLESEPIPVKVSLPIAYQATSLLQQMTSKEKSDEELQSLLSLIPHKYIKFYENVRPPYMGTYSKDVILPIDDPFSTAVTGYNYDYDSDLEWANEEEEEAEGGIENLESGEEEEDDDEEEASEGEFDGFLDTEDRDNGGENGSRRKKFIGPLIPKVYARENRDQMDEDDRQYFDMVAIHYLIKEQPFPINPLKCIESHVAVASKTPMDSQGNSSTPPSTLPEKKNKSLISDPGDLLKLFDEIQDSTFSLGTVTEIAQKNLPLYSKQIIKNTVKEYATRTNLGAARKWIMKNPQYLEQLRSDCNDNVK